MPRVGLVIPALNAARYLPALTRALTAQSLVPARVVLIDSSSCDATAALARAAGWDVVVIAKREFNHGGTRNRGAALVGDVDVLAFMTQDALPADERFLERLVAPVVAGDACAAYARQIPYDGARASEAYARAYNYPAMPRRRTAADIDRLGIRAFFFSNVASAIDARAFRELGGFPDDVVMNEDMLFCAKALRAGKIVAYAADAVVRHSHDYTIAQQFRRYFDIGAFLSEAGGELATARSGGEGIAFAARQAAWLVAHGHLEEAGRSVAESAAKWLAYQLGRRQRRLSRPLKRRLSLHRGYW